MKMDSVGFLNRFLLRHWPRLAMRLFANEIGIENVTFDKAHELFSGVGRIDLFPTHGTRGFILVMDRKTALFFYQEGDHFSYDGFEMGRYNKGEVTVVDGLNKNVSPYP